ncbi:outer membrane receptor FepA [Azotobacter vinelandii CA]|uniref:TonB-dependent ferrisiderophore receptor protein n=2 Tax=Azotobacter vinelandii TaxID=354 RepID=C1DRX3_AZOVD|nr:TonB-dependent siderophore receptor [Azotobacter vinelandii]ACO79848.1 TonB-dependent ferrisiderophore receptor protein [Azotobacter vinelandii DJ]AGK12873.1 outer membrane receptor FepA [Azotobacter vinelandii CA]AGK21550.1 outer membrane receptor FepA [Azotobacter vinelandii CA6]GLK62342.1 outer membrane receptor FepA [Azotobacter vinelandii]
MYPRFRLAHLPLALLAVSSPFLEAAEETTTEEGAAGDGSYRAEEGALELDDVLVTAERELKQAPGVSIITADDIKKRPPVNDLSDIIRKMPGVNLTGNSASGQYGNNRQIDIRGMGPENTLILIDGKPVRSRNSVRMGRSGERNTRGDTNWVPAELVERIEVLRGPAAARYGSGAMGGVVNIITKAPTEKTHGSVSTYYNSPESEYEGLSKRYNFSLTGPLVQGLSYRIHGNLNKTEADRPGLNSAYTADGGITPPAGKEGVRNRDLNGMLRWDLNSQQTIEIEGSYSRQGNIYAGDRAVSTTGSELLNQLFGRETNIMYRRAGSLTHRGNWDWGTSQLVFSYENTRNRRLNEGLAGSSEGSINAGDMSTSEYDNYALSGEVNIPFNFGFSQVATLGFEYTKEVLDDPFSMSQSATAIPGTATTGRDSEATNENIAFFVENNIHLTDRWTLTPGVRFDNHTQFGSNWSPSLNTSYQLTDAVSIKGGLSRAFKAPNLYQSNSNYIYYTMGNGCPADSPNMGGGCYVQGSDDLDAEKSWNFELGVAYAQNGWNAGVTYFRNEYEDKIVAGLTPTSITTADGQILQWENASKAVVAGWEGTLNIPLMGVDGDVLSWNTNFTYMIENKNKRTGEPLSVIPKFTINSILDWQATEALNLNLSMTLYGYQDPRNLSGTGAQESGEALKQQGGYTLWAVNGNYELTKNWSFGAGINNLLDKEIKREGNASGSGGASTYNDPGRAYYASAKFTF